MVPETNRLVEGQAIVIDGSGHRAWEACRLEAPERKAVGQKRV